MLTFDELKKREEEAWTRCDFCMEKRPLAKVYQAIDTLTGPMPLPEDDKHNIAIVNDDGNWAACEICAPLIDNDMWVGLAARAKMQLDKDHPEGTSNEALQFLWRKVFGDRVKL